MAALVPLHVKSRLLPLSAWLKSMEWLVECLPRRLIQVQLSPANGIAVIDLASGTYRAVSGIASFALTLDAGLPECGWYYLEVALTRHTGSRLASISIDLQHDAREGLTIPIPSNLRGTVREVIYLPSDIAALCWSPTADAGFFSQSPFLLHRISPLESFLRRTARVVFDLWRFRNRTPDSNAGLTWWRVLSSLHDAYSRTVALRLKRAADVDYSAFVAMHDTLKSRDIRRLRKQVLGLSLRPLISLIMRVDQPTDALFRAALDAVCGQIYPHWELILLGRSSDDARISARVDAYRSKNLRIKIAPHQVDESLAASLNRALAMAQGEFVVRIHQSDQIAVHALFFLAQEINRHPSAELIYSDHDSMGEDQQRRDPRFKPDWNPDLFFSHNYISCLSLYRRARALKLGGYRHGFDEATDYDLFLRFINNLPEANIRHIPRVLCHSKMESLRALSAREIRLREESLRNANRCALQAHFAGSGISVENGLAPDIYRIKYPLPHHSPLVSIIIPTRDQPEILRDCVLSIQQNTDYENWELLIVDNQSIAPQTHAYLHQLQGDRRIRVLRFEEAFNFSALNNFAVRHSKGEVLALLNNDVEAISKGWLTEMVSQALRPEIGAVGAKLLYSNGTVQHAGVILGLGGVAGHAHRYLKGDDHGYCQRAVVTQNLSAVTGACLVVRKSCYQEVGGLNEADLAVAFNDIDFCLKLVAAGYRNLFTPFALLYHHESLSRGPDDTPEKNARFVHESEYMKKTWGSVLKNDAAYNPNLTLDFETFALGRPREVHV